MMSAAQNRHAAQALLSDSGIRAEIAESHARQPQSLKAASGSSLIPQFLPQVSRLLNIRRALTFSNYFSDPFS